MARSWESIHRKISLTQELLQEVGLSLEAILEGYPDSEFLFRPLGLKSEWTEEDNTALLEKTIGTRHHRNHRNERLYVADLVLGWIVEDTVIYLLNRHGYSCKAVGSDASRELKKGHQTSVEPDILITTSTGEQWYSDILSDYPTERGAISYWKHTKRCDLRDNKLCRLAEQLQEGHRVGLVGVSVGAKEHFGIEITRELVEELQSPPTRNRRIYRTETHWPFGGKPAVRLNLNLLKVQFLPIREFPRGLPFVEST